MAIVSSTNHHLRSRTKREIGVAAVRAGVGVYMTKRGHVWPRSRRQCTKLTQTRPVGGSGQLERGGGGGGSGWVLAVDVEQDVERQATK